MTDFTASQVVASPSPATSGTSLTVVSGQGALFPRLPFYAVVTDSSNVTGQIDPSIEIIRVTGQSVDTFTIVRAQQGTTARAIDVGDRIYAGDVAGLPSAFPATGLTSVIPGGILYPPLSRAADAANRWFALQVHLLAESLIEGITYFVGTVSSGNVRVAMYDDTGTNRIANSTAVAQTASEHEQHVQFTSAVNAGPGTYYLLLWFSASTGTAMYNAFLAPVLLGTQTGGTPTSVAAGTTILPNAPVMMTF